MESKGKGGCATAVGRLGRKGKKSAEKWNKTIHTTAPLSRDKWIVKKNSLIDWLGGAYFCFCREDADDRKIEKYRQLAAYQRGMLKESGLLTVLRSFGICFLCWLINKPDDIVGRAAQDPAQAFQCGQSDIFIFSQAVQRFIIDPAFDQLVLRDVLFFHSHP